MLAAYLSSARPTILYRKQRIASLVALPAVIATLWAYPQAVQAQQYWTGDAGTSDWGTAGNWTSAVPTSSTFTYLGDNGKPATTVISADADARYLSLGTDASADLTVTGGATTLTVSDDLGIGETDGITASMTVTGATVNADRTFVGASGTGALTLEAGANLTSSSVYLGFDDTASGTLIVTGSGTLFAPTAIFSIGTYGTGSVTLDDGAMLDAGYTDIGEFATGTGIVTVSNGATWTSDSLLVVGSGGTGTLAISSGGSVDSFAGVIGYSSGSTGSVTVDGTGSIWTNTGGLWVGYEGAGTLTLSNDGVTTVDSGTGAVNLGTYSGSTGTLNIGAAAGSAAVAAGTLNAGSVVFGDGTGLIVFNHTDTNYDFGADISGAGSVAVYSGATILSGSNTYTGGTTLYGGTFSVNGSITGNVVLSGGTLGGSGNVGTISAGSGSTVAPGNSIGTLTAASASFAAGSTYAVELNDGGFVAGTNNDFINATGTLTLTGGAVSVTPVNGTDNGATYTPGTYTIITAAGGVTGTFTSVSDSYVFRDFSLGYDANNVFLTSTQVAFDTIAETPNQKAAAGSIDSLGSGNAIHDAVLGVSTVQQARNAFDAASGEGFATFTSAALQTSRYTREAMLGRSQGSGTGGWATAYSARSTLAGDGNAAAANFATDGMVIGYDHGVGDFTLGAAVHFGLTRLSLPDRATSIRSTDIGAGFYGSARFDGLTFAFGGDITRHQITSERQVSLTGFSNTLTASYAAYTTQVFGEVSYDFDFGATTLTPFARAAFVHTSFDAFTETGGAAALSSAAGSYDAFVTTLGLRARQEIALDNGGTGWLEGMIGWRHAFVASPGASNSFAGGGAFSVTGASLAQDALLIGVGIGVEIAPGATVSLGYSGEFSGNSVDHAISAQLTWRF